MEQLEVTVVGAGVIGCAVALELSRAGETVVVIEKNPGVCEGENQSTRNSGVIHAGLYYDRRSRPLKAALCAAGNRLLYDFCRVHNVPALQCGKLIVATDDRQLPVLHKYHARATQNDVPVRLLDADQVREKEPKVRARAALWLPTAGIIDPAALVRRIHALASNSGAQFFSGTEVTGIRPTGEGLEVRLQYPDGAGDVFLTKKLVNCAGLYSDSVAAMADPASDYRIDPLCGEAMKFYRGKRTSLALNGTNVYPTPQRVTTDRGTYFTVGVHLTPTLETDARGVSTIGPVVTVGPLNHAAAGRESHGGPYRPASEFHRRVATFFPGLTEADLTPHQIGIQARLAGHQDWVIGFCPREPRLVNLLGIDSPGVTGALAIARYVRSMLLG